MNIIPRIFVGSSSESLALARAVEKEFTTAKYEVVVWSDSFGPSRPTIVQLVSFITRFDFGVFIFSPDDELRIRNEDRTTVRDNVLLEAGIFLGGLGIDRTYIVKVKSAISLQAESPSNSGGKRALRDRQPTDLDGFVTLNIERPAEDGSWDVSGVAAQIQKSIDSMGPAIRNPHNEVLFLKTALQERILRGKKKKKCFRLSDLVRSAAQKRHQPWVLISDPLSLMEAIEQSGAPPEVIDDAYWWLIVEGIYIFKDIDHFTSEDSWKWSESIPFVRLSERGTALLNEYRAELARPSVD